ncbi:MAG: DUF456 domain-containing protein [Cyclobacteriaceae bacterium]|nr:DUF456 domain-containing protein [Cyclobacteriaceae bacterium]
MEILEIDWVEIVWIIVGAGLSLVGIIGCFVPILPGPPFNYVALLLLQLRDQPPFDANFLLLWLFITIAVTALDYVIPVIGTKKLGGSKYGVYGSGIGLLLGIIFFPPFGIIIGPFLGAFAGELMYGKTGKVAFRAALGSFIGFLTGTFIKLVSSVVMTYYFVDGIIN